MTTDNMSTLEAAVHEPSSKSTAEDHRLHVCVSGSPDFHRQALWRHLEGTGHSLGRFTDDRALLEAITTDFPSAMVYEMPATREGAIEVLNQLTELKQDACVILIGPEIGAELVAECLRYGAFDYLTVPVAITRLMTSFRDGLVNRQTFRAVRNLSEELAHSNGLLAGERNTLKQWIAAADSALYDVKALGRNCVVAHVIPRDGRDERERRDRRGLGCFRTLDRERRASDRTFLAGLAVHAPGSGRV